MIDTTKMISDLVDIEILTMDGKLQEAATELTNLKIVTLVNYLVNKDMNGGLDSEEMKIVELIIKITQEIYNNASETVSPIRDEEFDKLYEVYKNSTGEEIVGAKALLATNIFSHQYPNLRGTLGKVHFITNAQKKPKEKRRSLEDFIRTVESKAGQLTSDSRKAVATLKWDGISAVIECDANGKHLRTLKRGNTDINEAEEIPNIFEDVNFGKRDNPYGLKVEIIMSQDNFKRLCEDKGEYSSPRSAVSSIINSKLPDKSMLQYLTLKKIRIQEQGQLEQLAANEEDIYSISNIQDFYEIEKVVHRMVKDLEDDGQFDVDGIVFTMTDINLQNILGRENNINQYEIALKLPPRQAKTIIRDVLMSVGIHGSVTPVAKVDPVKMRGNFISSPSLGSIDRFRMLNLSPGDEVILKYDIIPYLDVDETCTKSGLPPFKAPTHCSMCGEKLVGDNIPRCVNEACQSRVLGKLLNYAQKMNIGAISVETIQVLWSKGLLTTIPEFYMLEFHRDEIVNMKRFGAKSFQRILDGINARKEVYDYELLGSLGITSIGRRIFKKVMEKYTIDELVDLAIAENYDELVKIPSIQRVTSEKLLRGVLSNEKTICSLQRILKVKRDNRQYNARVAFTKVRDKEFEKFLDTRGILVSDSYNKNVNILIVPDYETTSSKVTKAEKDGAKIVSIKDAYKLFEYVGGE